MSASSPGQPVPDPSSGIDDLERFLATASEQTRARQAAEAFADHMPYLTTAERRQLVSLYARERLADAKCLRIQLAQQNDTFEARDRLRRRCVTVAWLIGASCAGLTLITLLTMAKH
jgi:hypothetical protein